MGLHRFRNGASLLPARLIRTHVQRLGWEGGHALEVRSANAVPFLLQQVDLVRVLLTRAGAAAASAAVLAEAAHAVPKCSAHASVSFGIDAHYGKTAPAGGTRGLMKHSGLVSGKPLDPSDICTASAANVICAVILGHRFSIDNDTFQNLSTSTTFVTHFMGSRWGQAYEAAPSLMRFIPGPHHMYPVHWNYLSNYMKQEVESHQENPCDEPQDLIDCYLEQISKTGEDLTSTFDEDNLNQILIDFFVAGSETITLTLLWALLHMVAHPEIQEKVQKELHTVLGPSKVIDYEDRKNLPYTNATIHEVQRYNTVVPTSLPHWCMKDAIIQGLPVEKDTLILVNLASANYDPKHWEKPQQFNPKHFLDESGNFLMKDAFSSFSAGPRVCLGERLAKTELFIFFANLLREFTFRPAPGENDVNLDSMFGTTLQPVPYKICAFPNQLATLP